MVTENTIKFEPYKAEISIQFYSDVIATGLRAIKAALACTLAVAPIYRATSAPAATKLPFSIQTDGTAGALENCTMLWGHGWIKSADTTQHQQTIALNAGVPVVIRFAVRMNDIYQTLIAGIRKNAPDNTLFIAPGKWKWGCIASAPADARRRYYAAKTRLLSKNALAWSIGNRKSHFRYWHPENHAPMPGLREALSIKH